jgi:hypothetical protein
MVLHVVGEESVADIDFVLCYKQQLLHVKMRSEASFWG